MKKVALYVRVSTQDQAEEGYSIDEQMDKLNKYCEIKGWTIYDSYIDPGFSGSTLKRPAMKRLIRDAKAKRFDLVLIYKLDRLSRNQQDTLYLIEDIFPKNGIEFVSFLENFDTSTPFGKAMVGIISVFAQLEREQITERMQMGKVGRAKSGKAMSWSKNPFGYIYQDDSYIINELEASIAKRIFQDYMNGISITKLRDNLNEEGHIGKNIEWSYRTVRQMLDNPVYAGYIKFKDEVYPGNHEPIISKELFDNVQIELEVRQKQAYENNNNPRPFQAKYMLSGMIRCGHCMAPLNVQLGKKQEDGSRISKYGCVMRTKKGMTATTIYNNGEKCTESIIHIRQELEGYVLNEISKLQLNSSNLEATLKVPQVIDYTTEYKGRINQINKKLEKLSDLYLNDMMSLEQMQSKAELYQKERKSLENQIQSNEQSLKQKTSNEILAYFKGNHTNIKEESYENQFIIVRKLVKKVDVVKDDVVIHWRI